jgi:hypothetical protein
LLEQYDESPYAVRSRLGFVLKPSSLEPPCSLGKVKTVINGQRLQKFFWTSLYWMSHNQRNARSRSVPPPIMAIPAAGLVCTPLVRPIRMYLYDAPWLAPANKNQEYGQGSTTSPEKVLPHSHIAKISQDT